VAVRPGEPADAATPVMGTETVAIASSWRTQQQRKGAGLDDLRPDFARSEVVSGGISVVVPILSVAR
jgi:hypothetical protein